jgi:hypothetical protein
MQPNEIAEIKYVGNEYNIHVEQAFQGSFLWLTGSSFKNLVSSLED